jgi:hypothetical protein
MSIYTEHYQDSIEFGTKITTKKRRCILAVFTNPPDCRSMAGKQFPQPAVLSYNTEKKSNNTICGKSQITADRRRPDERQITEERRGAGRTDVAP